MKAWVTDVVVEDVAVLVPALALPAGWIEVAVAVGIQDITRPQEAGKRAAHGRMVENLLNPGNSGQNIVSDIALFFEYGFNLPEDAFVERSG